MKRTHSALVVIVLLSACQATNSSPGANDVLQTQTGVRASVAADQCLGQYSRHVLRRAGSVQNGNQIQLAPQGDWHYGPQNKRVHGAVYFETCNYNYFDVPVPDGYVASWFGGLHLCGDSCTFVFGNFDANAITYAVGEPFTQGVQYYLYAYTGKGKQLIESYPIGETSPKGVDKLDFDSPLENGFVWPRNDFVVFEIVSAG